MYLKLIALAAMQAMALEAAAADFCAAGHANSTIRESTPNSSFNDNGDGTVTHALTALTWKQCVQGLSGTGCATGAASVMTWSAALRTAVNDTTAGHSDWRLPNKKELESIVETCGYTPAINRSAFPNTPSSYFWSSSSYGQDPSNAWIVNFNLGFTNAYSKTAYSFNVRLVRGGQPPDSFDALPVKQSVVEYLNINDFPNSPGGHYFYSSNPTEQAAVDAGFAGQFARTGRQFRIGGSAPVCRFYGSVNPGPNSHFFTVDVTECNTLKALQVTPTPTAIQQWNYEGIGYQTTPAIVAVNGTRSCPAETLPLYRAYNNAFPLSGPKNPWDSNHRFTPLLSDIADLVAHGWRDEGIVFCTAQ